MSIDVYIYSYPKTDVSKVAAGAWDKGQAVSHVGHVFAEVKGDTDVLEWCERISFCYEALQRLTPKDDKGHYRGDNEFPVGKEQLITFKENIINLDQTEEDGIDDKEYVGRSLDKLQELIDNFNFDEKYLTIHTD